MNNIINIYDVECYEEKGTVYLKLDIVAKGLGFIDTSKGKEYIRWNVVKQYLKEIGFSHEVAKNSFIPENIFYRLAMKAKNDTAEKFQALVADKIIPSIRKNGYYSKDDEKQQKLEIQKQRANAMELNAKTRAYKAIIQSIDKNKALSSIAMEVLSLKALETAFSVEVGNLLPETERTYSATEVGKMLGISANKVGRIATANGLKTEEYGVFVMDKSRHSTKEVESFRYNEKGLGRLKELYALYSI